MIKFKKNKSFSSHSKKKFCPFCSCKLEELFIEGRTRMFCNKCEIPIYENPTPAACILLINNINKILLVKRKVKPKKENWCLPGGFIEIDETAEQAAKRKLNEETGLKCEIDSLIGISSNNSNLLHSILVIAYLAKHFFGTLIPGDDASEVYFFDINDIPKIETGSR